MLGTGKPKLGGLGDVGCLSRNNEGEFRISPNLGVISVIWDFGTRNTKKKNETHLLTSAVFYTLYSLPTYHLRASVFCAHFPLAYLGVFYSLLFLTGTVPCLWRHGPGLSVHVTWAGRS